MSDSRPPTLPRAAADLAPALEHLARLAPPAALTQVQRLLPSGNLVDVTAGVLIGGALGGATNSLIREVITPALGLVTAVATGGPPAGAIQWTAFAGSLANCVMVTAVAGVGLAAYRRVVPAPPPTTHACRFCLSEVPIQALRCRYCTSELARESTVPVDP